MMKQNSDRVGVTWSEGLGPAILRNIDKLDVVQINVDDLVHAPTRKLESIRSMAANLPLTFHSSLLGVASAHLVDGAMLQQITNVLKALNADNFSVDLGFARAGIYEIGAAAASPRTIATVDGATRNFEMITAATGLVPALGNVATLINPPGSKLDEATWISQILFQTKAPMLLDLYSAYANAFNFAYEPTKFLKDLPLEQVTTIHLSGGQLLYEPQTYSTFREAKRLASNETHSIPRDVFKLLEWVSAEAAQKFTVIIEREGDDSEFPDLLNEVQQARKAIESGRATARRKSQAEFLGEMLQ
ncbi:MAG: DUF692 family protein [Proteobacteria bacterium]|nr:MAG: DUF692 family protein [Pseudomonadota bacterium]